MYEKNGRSFEKTKLPAPVKNLEYVKKSQAKKKEELGAEAYNKINANVEKNEQNHGNAFKATIGEAEF